MKTDPVEFTVKIRGMLDKYKAITANAYNMNHAQAKRILEEIADHCSRAETLHDAIVAREMGEKDLADRLVGIANAGLTTEE